MAVIPGTGKRNVGQIHPKDQVAPLLSVLLPEAVTGRNNHVRSVLNNGVRTSNNVRTVRNNAVRTSNNVLTVLNNAVLSATNIVGQNGQVHHPEHKNLKRQMLRMKCAGDFPLFWR
jgi:hypothetical protein